MTSHGAQAAIGLDVGGTAIKAGLVSSDGQIIEKAAVATQADAGVDPVIGRMLELIERFRRSAASRSMNVEAVGLGMPGTLCHRRGIVIAPPNLPGWRDVPIVERIHAATGMRIVLDNDANNAALGEYLCGAGRGARDIVMLTLGTGIGGGVILDGKLWHGAGGNAGELGHIIVHAGGRRCRCGQAGCLEAYASAAGTAARATERIAAGEPSTLKNLLDGGEPIVARHVVEAAADGDDLAKQVWNETCLYLALGCISIHHVLHPERIILAGGMSAAGSRLLTPVVEAVARQSSKMLAEPPEILLAELGNDAGLVGSALSTFRTG